MSGEFDPDSLTWRVFAAKVREERGHELVARRHGYGECRRCRLSFTAPLRLQHGWMTDENGDMPWLTPSAVTALRCPGTRPY